MDVPHIALHQLRARLSQIYTAISSYHPSHTRPPILDSSLDTGAADDDGQWLHQDNVQGLKKLKDSVKIDLDVLGKFLDDPQSVQLPALSTNAPYLIAVWHELLCAPAPVDAVFKMFPLTGPSTADSRQRGAQRPPAAKVDIVADNGKRWIRVNTIKNSRMLSEFREIDSYLTESDSDSSYEAMEGAQPTLAQTEFDNSILRMGRSLVAASKAHPIIEGGSELPNITLRLTRLDPTAPEGDPRLGETVRLLQDMGIHVELGERQDSELPEGVVHDKGPSSRASSPPPPPPPPPLTPSADINLDLSVLIALISDLTHARLPRTVEDANTRFIPPQSYREWKLKKNGMYGKKKKKKKKTGAAQGAQAQARSASPSPSPSSSPTPSSPAPPAEVSPETLPSDLAKHSRALTNQLLQEMGKGLLHELASKMACAGGAVRFWTTREARDRCLRIVAKIGGASERRRARALFWEGVKEEEEGEEKVQSGEEAEEMYWRGSRYPMRFVGLFPIHLYEAALSAPTTTTTTALPPFFDDLAQTCRDILAQETIPHPRALPEALVSEDAGPPPLVAAAEIPARQGEIQRAVVTKANPRLTAHTVQSLRIGAERGWTTLTANKASVKAILREMKGARGRGRGRLGGVGGEGGGEERRAVIWIVDPRSLAEGMSNTR